jgi:anti-sigma regulatory factor (Ser/Thr protein kinase)
VKEAATLELDVVADLTTVGEAQRIVEGITLRLCHNADLAWRVAMAAHELLDNARKYSSAEKATVRLELASTDDEPTVTLSVRSRSADAQKEALSKVVSEIATARDAWEFYLAAMQRSLGAGERSGIGLARIRAEGQMRLAVSADSEGYTWVIATLHPGGAEA